MTRVWPVVATQCVRDAQQQPGNAASIRNQNIKGSGRHQRMENSGSPVWLRAQAFRAFLQRFTDLYYKYTVAQVRGEKAYI